MRSFVHRTLYTTLIVASALQLAARTAIAGEPAIAVPSFAQDRATTTTLRVTPDHPDWTYQPGEHVIFRVQALWDQVPVNGLAVKYRIGAEMMPAEDKAANLTADGLVIDGGTLDHPGFLRCTVTADYDGTVVTGVATAGFAPDRIVPTQRNPDDFDRFWEDGKAALGKIPMDPELTLIPEASSSTINVYHVSLATWGVPGVGQARVYGILCAPKASGKYPAMLRVPGAGVRPYSGDRTWAKKGFITFEIGVHGVPVNLPAELYTSLAAAALNNYPTIHLDDRERYYYRRVYLACVRANDFITSLPDWDGRNLLVVGGSQGGQLSIVTAGLDSRVTALSASFPAFCDVTGYLQGRAGGWPHMFRPRGDGKPSDFAKPDDIATTAYYDTVNFARRVKVPGLYTWGYNDQVCPPTSTFSAYNVITAPKELVLALEMGHDLNAAQIRRQGEWIRAHAK